ncbi:MAG: hypothetical protein R2695_11685 [Acidimicrobiales bacterium]
MVDSVGSAEIASRAAAGTLTELDGIGKSTAEVIVDAPTATTTGTWPASTRAAASRLAWVSPCSRG